MFGRIRTSLSYANVVATMALFIALGGSSYAALKITGKDVKNSSLTGKDVRNASLTGKDVRDGSLAAADFGAGQLPTGPQGPKGEPGPQGPQGEKGEKGDRGPAGSDASLDGVQAGGALAGTYPSPSLSANAVGSINVANNSLLGVDIDESSLDQVPSAANAGTAGNAAKLGGKDPSDYVGRCAKGSIAGHATFWTGGLVVGAAPRNVPAYGGETGYNCSGGAVTVKKTGTGRYEVALPGTGYSFAMVSANNYGSDTTYLTAADGPWGNGVVKIRVNTTAGPADPYYVSVLVPAN